ncbi:conserved hypothetical protein [Catenulispora acidiphila DSM 44928]|uniref:PIN like domain-containing protein n=1 Tax=Catenulispora acidiphila (strain DSM 44928 / JCM 14897 / NBRC 102108 / NRRL B-24433 / ID139908) TaxID=479433 RepID=C7PYP0_CATAD|nr:PIN-like domain-containing protein [Catenulispora acidiphila]ACU77362.1 conserved hypothetical protein [Catenulispora acidiphila DSM 44928]
MTVLDGDAAEPRNPVPAKQGGLFDGFEGYRTPTDADYQAVLASGLVVPDANVLLNLYRYTEEAREDLLSVLTKLGDRLWVPHQVLVEFWRNRESALSDPETSAANTAGELAKLRVQALGAIRNWGHRVALPAEELSKLCDDLSESFDVAEGAIKGLASAGSRGRWNTNDDPVILKLTTLLDGRVGVALNGEEYERAVKEGLQRVKDRRPPGYMDKAKDGDNAAGDYLVWEQVLIEAGRQGSDVLFVTGDVKEDWWRRDRGQTRGPRLELVQELLVRGGGHLYMMQPSRLLEIAGLSLDVEVREGSIEDVERVNRLHAEDLDFGGWSTDALQELFYHLEDEGYGERVSVIRWAAENDGIASREAVYGLGGYAEERQLKGFTRPVSRIAKEFRRLGIISPNAVDILETVYDPAFSYVQAAGFRVHPSVVPLILQLSEEVAEADQEEG